MKFEIKMIYPLLFLQFLISCLHVNEKTFTASTPAAPVIRTFLRIPSSDSIDFIRFNLTLADNKYLLDCNYGIAKNNTNGFIDGGKKVSIKGSFNKEKNIYRLHHLSNVLKIAELNVNLLHILNTDNNLLVGNGGWSYSLNNIHSSATDQVNIIAEHREIKDSVVFDGRTPCKIPGIIPAGKECYKLKWRIVLYPPVNSNSDGKFKIYGTPYYDEGGRKGNWKVKTGKDNRVIYQLNDDKGNSFLHLLKLDENILVFTDAAGNLLVGDGDFSYTLNRMN